MGMFDRVSGLKVKCPKCHKNRDRKWQTKAFENMLIDYRIGEHVEIKETTFDCIGECPICKSMNTVRVNIENGILTDKYTIID